MSVTVSVSIDGAPQEAHVARSSGHSTLDEAAVMAVRQWRFIPASQDNRPVPANATVSFVFRLED